MRLQLAVVILAWVVGTHAIFEEQAGLVDWHAEQLGRIEHAHFAFRGRDRLFVGSKAGVVASLDTKDGSIVWRQVWIMPYRPVAQQAMLVKSTAFSHREKNVSPLQCEGFGRRYRGGRFGAHTQASLSREPQPQSLGLEGVAGPGRRFAVGENGL